MPDTIEFLQNLDNDERIIILETFVKSLADADFFDDMADHFDYSDEKMVYLREKIQEFLTPVSA